MKHWVFMYCYVITKKGRRGGGTSVRTVTAAEICAVEGTRLVSKCTDYNSFNISKPGNIGTEDKLCSGRPRVRPIFDAHVPDRQAINITIKALL